MKTVTIKDFIIEIQDELSQEYTGLTIEEILNKMTDELQAHGLWLGFSDWGVMEDED